MKNSNQTKQEYRTAKQEKRRRTLRAVLSFLAFVVLIAGVSIFYYWSNSDYKPPEEVSEQADDVTVTDSENKELGSAVFFVYLQSEKEAARSAALVNVDAGSHLAEVRVLSRKQIKKLNSNGELSVSAQCNQVLQSQLGESADRCVIVNERGFKDVVNTLGGLEIFMEEQSEFVWEGTKRTLLKGKNLMRGESLLRFLQWSAQEGDRETQGEILCGLLVLGLNANNRAKGEALFEELINAVESDISAMDYILAQEELDSIAQNGLTAKYKK